MTKKVGRPTDTGVRRSELIGARVTPEEKESMKQLAKSMEFDSISEFIRFFCLYYEDRWGLIQDGD